MIRPFLLQIIMKEEKKMKHFYKNTDYGSFLLKEFINLDAKLEISI